MSHNVMQEYIELTKKQINTIMKFILDDKFQRQLSDEILDDYIKVRYLGFYKENEEDEEKSLSLRKKIMKVLKEKELQLIEQNPQKEMEIQNLFIFYYYILYFDGVIISKEIKNVIEKIEKLRVKVYKKEIENFKGNLYKLIDEQQKIKEKFLQKYETEDFYLKITNYPSISQVYKVKLKDNITFPMIYSTLAIKKAFKTGIISEDKLNVEYSLIAVDVIKDIIKQNYNKQYIIEFSISLLNKQKKLKSILNIINNQAIQDKVSLKIKYQDFITNKDSIYELLRNGFRMAVVLDDSIEITFTELDKLNVFQYIIVNKKMEKYNAIIENKLIIKNLIEI